MSFLDHLDELRKRLVSSVIIIVVAFMACWFVSGYIYDFLSVPIRRALSEAARRDLPVQRNYRPRSDITDRQRERRRCRPLHHRPSDIDRAGCACCRNVGTCTGVARDSEGKLGLFTTEPLFTNNAIVPKGVRLPVEYINDTAVSQPNADERMTVTTAPEQFTLYVTVSLYSAIAISIPLLLWQIWMFISPALYKHERSYVTPFIGLSSVSFVIGAAFAYYVLFPPAASYLLGLGGGEFQLLLKASDYLDFIIIIMFAMGLIFQMPAIAYVLARIGILSAGFMLRTWKVAIVIILIVAAVASPTGDIPNMMLFAAPMFVLYAFSIFIAWFFGKKRKTDAEV